MQACIPVTTVCMGLTSPLVALITQQLPRDLDPGLVEDIPAKEGTERASMAIARDWVKTGAEGEPGRFQGSTCWCCRRGYAQLCGNLAQHPALSKTG